MTGSDNQKTITITDVFGETHKKETIIIWLGGRPEQIFLKLKGKISRANPIRGILIWLGDRK